MKTLIELYDEQPMRNVLSTEMFHPEETILLCPPEIAGDKRYARSVRRYLDRRGCMGKLRLIPVSLLDAQKIAATLQNLLRECEDCAVDISGGTDAALFAAGMVCGKAAVFTYSRKRNTFFEIRNAPFARSLPCTVRLDAESCVMMAGGTLLPGRENNEVLRNLLPEAERLFAVYGRFRREWNRQIAYIQQISESSDPGLRAAGPWTVKADRTQVTASEALLRDLEEAGLIHALSLETEGVSFNFLNEAVRFWLRDVGSALEVYVYRACLLAGCFDDVVLSAVVNWDAEDEKAKVVTNEIDVMAVRGVEPVFISCKACPVKTEALNELAILRDRFGGKGSRAMIVTTSGGSHGTLAMRKRAAELGIEVLDWEDLAEETLIRKIRG